MNGDFASWSMSSNSRLEIATFGAMVSNWETAKPRRRNSSFDLQTFAFEISTFPDAVRGLSRGFRPSVFLKILAQKPYSVDPLITTCAAEYVLEYGRRENDRMPLLFGSFCCDASTFFEISYNFGTKYSKLSLMTLSKSTNPSHARGSISTSSKSLSSTR